MIVALLDFSNRSPKGNPIPDKNLSIDIAVALTLEHLQRKLSFL
jgi:Mn-dependent DtxR family transcriptional regulator